MINFRYFVALNIDMVILWLFQTPITDFTFTIATPFSMDRETLVDVSFGYIKTVISRVTGFPIL